MTSALMTICVLVAFLLAKSVYGRPAIDNDGSSLNVLPRGSTLEDSLDYKRTETLSPLQESAPIPTKTRLRRLSDQRLAELETLMALRKANCNTAGNESLNLTKIGRRKRSATEETPSETTNIYPLSCLQIKAR